MAKDFFDRPPQRAVSVVLGNGSRVGVDYASRAAIAGLTTGQGLSVTGGASGPRISRAAVAPEPRARAAPKLRRRVAAAAVTTLPGGVRASSGGLPTTSNPLRGADLSTIVIPVMAVDASGNACPGTSLPPYSVASIRGAVLPETNPTGTTVGSQYRACSNGRATLNAKNSVVADWARLGCTGTGLGGIRWSFATCDDDFDVAGWADAADSYVLRMYGIDVNDYNHRVYVMPPGMQRQCGWVGMGYVGCDGTFECRAWISGEYHASPSAYMHEQGHNLYLQHAGAMDGGSFDEYADYSCAMGYCCAQRCYNTPHQWQMGWQALQQVDSGALPAGGTVAVTLPAQHTSPAAGVRLAVGTWAPGASALYLGYRQAAGPDSALPAKYANKVNIYQTALSGGTDDDTTKWLAAVPVGGSWASDPKIGIVVRVLSQAGGSGVSVSVCRRAGAETAASCAAGADNDCNGLAGAADGACAAFKGVSPAAKPSPSPSPSPAVPKASPSAKPASPKPAPVPTPGAKPKASPPPPRRSPPPPPRKAPRPPPPAPEYEYTYGVYDYSPPSAASNCPGGGTGCQAPPRKESPAVSPPPPQQQQPVDSGTPSPSPDPTPTGDGTGDGPVILAACRKDVRSAFNTPQTACVNDAWAGWSLLKKPSWTPCCPGLACFVRGGAASSPYGYCIPA